MTESIAVDTNWLLDVALLRDADSLTLWEEVRQGTVQLLVPAISIAETVKVLEGWEKEWRRFSAHFKSLSGVSSPDEMLQASAQLSDQAERLVWQTLEDVSTTAKLLELTRSAIAGARSVTDFLNLSAADALVLSLVVDACEAGTCRDFLSRDRVFRKDEIGAYMEEKGIAHWNNAGAFLAARSSYLER